MHYKKGILAIIVSLGLALALLPLSITGGDNGPVTVGIDAPAEVIAVDEWNYVPAGPVDTGKIRVVTLSFVPLACVNGTGYLAQIHFDAVGSAGDSSPITLEGVGMYDCRAVAIITTTLGASVDISGPAPPVGGTAHPISKVAIVALWIAVGAAIIVGTSLLVRRRRRAMR